MKVFRVNKENLHLAKESAELFFWNGDSDKDINKEFFESNRNIIYVAVEDGKVVGSVYGYALDRYDINKKQLFIYSIDVLHKYRKQGIGKKLIKQFIKDLSSGEYYNAFVITNKENHAAVNLYKSTGAKQIISDDGDDIIFRWIAR